MGAEKDLNSMSVPGLSFENTFVGTGWICSVLVCINGLRKQCSHLVGPQFPVAFFPVWMSGCRVRAVIIASLLMGGYVLSHKHVEDGCMGTCVKFGAESLTKRGDMVSLMYA